MSVVRRPLRALLAVVARLLRTESPWLLSVLVILMLLVALTESVGLLLLVPLAEIVLSGVGSDSPVIALIMRVFAWLGIPATLSGLVVTFLVLVVCREFLRYRRDMLISMLRFHMVDLHRNRTLHGLLQAQWRHVANHSHAEYANVLITDVNRTGQGLSFALTTLALLAQLILGLLAALALSWVMTVVALAVGAALVSMMGQFRRRALMLGREVSQSNAAIQGAVQEILSGLRLAKLLGQEGRLQNRFGKRLSALRQQQLRFQSGVSATESLMHVGGAVLLALFLLGGLRFGQVPLSELTVLSLILARMLPLFSALQQQLLQSIHSLPFIQNVFALQDSLALVVESRLSRPVQVPQRDIRLEHAGYTHVGRTVEALHGVSLTLPVGSVTALVGPSGSGKSTLADILSGMVSPESGHLLLDDVPLTAQQLSGWRQHVACVPQDSFLFNDTVRQNLLWACPDATEAQMQDALTRAAAEFVLALPDGLDTQVGERGLLMSGGERQRIALARALLCRPAVLILDESTSALDKQSEIRIAEVVDGLRGSLTIVLIAHRGALLPLADHVVTLDHGVVQCVDENERQPTLLFTD